MSAAPHWTQEQTEQILAMRRDGLTLTAMAAVIGRSRKAIDNRFRRLKLSGLDVPRSAVAKQRLPDDVRRAKGAEKARRKRAKKREQAMAARGVVVAPVPVVVVKPEPKAEPQRITPPRRRRFVSILCAPVETARVADVARHLDAVGHEAPWTPALDLALVEGLLSPLASREAVLAAVARAAGLDREAALARFRLLARPIRNAVGVLDTDGQANLLAVLRSRALQQEVA